jgi:hypothetical protein
MTCGLFPEGGAGFEIVALGFLGEGGPAGGLFRVGSDAGCAVGVEFREKLGGGGFAEFGGVGEPADGCGGVGLGGGEFQGLKADGVGGGGVAVLGVDLELFHRDSVEAAGERGIGLQAVAAGDEGLRGGERGFQLGTGGSKRRQVCGRATGRGGEEFLGVHRFDDDGPVAGGGVIDGCGERAVARYAAELGELTAATALRAFVATYLLKNIP